MSNPTCLEADDDGTPEAEARTHCWHRSGLDNDSEGRLVSVRRCVWCNRLEHKTYGRRHSSWRYVKERKP